MAILRSAPAQDGTLIDVLDRVLDKGIVFETHLRYAEELGLISADARPCITS
jgi:hypothetical protein